MSPAYPMFCTFHCISVIISTFFSYILYKIDFNMQVEMQFQIKLLNLFLSSVSELQSRTEWLSHFRDRRFSFSPRLASHLQHKYRKIWSTADHSLV